MVPSYAGLAAVSGCLLSCLGSLPCYLTSSHRSDDGLPYKAVSGQCSKKVKRKAQRTIWTTPKVVLSLLPQSVGQSKSWNQCTSKRWENRFHSLMEGDQSYVTKMQANWDRIPVSIYRGKKSNLYDKSEKFIWEKRSIVEYHSVPLSVYLQLLLYLYQGIIQLGWHWG